MSLRKMKSKFFSRSNAPPSSMVSSTSNSQNARGHPPMPATRERLRISAIAPPKIQKSQKQPPQVALITNEMIRELRELIRYRYALDCKIWDLGWKVRWYQRDTVEADMRRSDAALENIRSTLEGWDKEQYFATKDEYAKFKEIKIRIFQSQTRKWSEEPPWVKSDSEQGDGLHGRDGRPHPSLRSSMNGRYSNGN
ncbi:hypothetical protein CC86DRAFT_209578 [Ophiobolus disseminans]|uniref:Uncharacterized protein n=1 Tax=Ophiobolus disseminans TaxID=1469910 RepID=A0A6A7A3F3_9PLEO|nr:hypothetical protein CC86DRAFT_209578 [Ophiobolus disseminans]